MEASRRAVGNRRTTASSCSSHVGAGPAKSYVVGAAVHDNIGKGTENQDTYIACQSPSGGKCFAGVFDGHGERGAEIARIARDQVSKGFFQSKDLRDNPRRAFEEAYKGAQSKLERRHLAAAQDSGSTAVAAYQDRDKLFVANCGDSRAVLGRLWTKVSSDAPGSNYMAVALSDDHKPGRQDERQRIIAAGGRVEQGQFLMQHGGYTRFTKAGPERVMGDKGQGGLAVSRSLGDLAMNPYLSARPEVTSRRLDAKDKFVVLGSDGIWDQVTSQEAVSIAGRCVEPASAAREIAQLARQRWQVASSGLMSDDITAVVMRLDTANTASPQRRGSRPYSARSVMSTSTRATTQSPRFPKSPRYNNLDGNCSRKAKDVQTEARERTKAHREERSSTARSGSRGATTPRTLSRGDQSSSVDFQRPASSRMQHGPSPRALNGSSGSGSHSQRPLTTRTSQQRSSSHRR
eukprot:TRINITY_DN5589_c0_g1_i1.p1 TRINITY_DN5589_c0_g1~~TRINITY_DN5589_c0_g1_i1.p1  ORF type:complete len:500 (+),score=73.94 TRINITY_DN5589_c0_g1_i1:116-1501(+)